MILMEINMYFKSKFLQKIVESFLKKYNEVENHAIEEINSIFYDKIKNNIIEKWNKLQEAKNLL